MARSFCSCFIKNAHNLASLAQFAQFALYAKAQQQNSADLIYIADKSSELQTSAVKNRRQVAVAKLERQAIARLEEERDIEIALASVKKRSKMRLIQEDMETKHLHNELEKDEGRKAALTEEKKKLQDGEKDAAMLNALKKTLTDKYDELIEDAEKRSRISEWRLQRFERLESGNATSELKALYEKERKEMEEMQLAGGAGGGGLGCRDRRRLPSLTPPRTSPTSPRGLTRLHSDAHARGGRRGTSQPTQRTCPTLVGAPSRRTDTDIPL